MKKPIFVVIAIFVVAMLCILTLFYVYQETIEPRLFQKMEVYPEAEEIVEENDRKEILSVLFIVGDMHLTWSDFVWIQQLENVSVYGTDAFGFKVYTWYLMKNWYGWARNNYWYKG